MENTFLEKLKNKKFYHEKLYEGGGTTYYGGERWNFSRYFKNSLSITGHHFINDNNEKYIECMFNISYDFSERWATGAERAPSKYFIESGFVSYEEKWLNSDKGEAFLEHLFFLFKNQITNEKEFIEIMKIMNPLYKRPISQEQLTMIEDYKMYSTLLEIIPENERNSTAALTVGQTIVNISSKYCQKYGKDINE